MGDYIGHFSAIEITTAYDRKFLLSTFKILF